MNNAVAVLFQIAGGKVDGLYSTRRTRDVLCSERANKGSRSGFLNKMFAARCYGRGKGEGDSIRIHRLARKHTGGTAKLRANSRQAIREALTASTQMPSRDRDLEAPRCKLELAGRVNRDATRSGIESEWAERGEGI